MVRLVRAFTTSVARDRRGGAGLGIFRYGLADRVAMPEGETAFIIANKGG